MPLSHMSSLGEFLGQSTTLGDNFRNGFGFGEYKRTPHDLYNDG